METTGEEDGAANPPLGDFKLSLSGTTCHGACPEFALSVDSTGQLSFEGKRCTARPGVFAGQVAAAQVAALALALEKSDYGSLRARYASRDDGCARVTSDAPNRSLTISARGEEKQIERYLGCEGAPAAARVDQLIAVLVSAAGAAPWIEPPPNCAGGPPSPSFETNYALAYQGAPLGLLALHWAHGDSGFASGWFTTCAMNEVGTGATMLVEPERRILMGPIMLPGVGKLGSIVLSRPAGGTAVRAVAYKDDGELELSIREATRCD